MTDIAKYKKVGGFLGANAGHARLEYDFSVDGGAAGSLDMCEAQAPMFIYNARVVVVTPCTSGGSATVAVGSTDDADGILDATSGAVASLTANSEALFEAAGQAGLYLDTGDKVSMAIATAALTAGKFEVHFDYHRIGA